MADLIGGATGAAGGALAGAKVGSIFGPVGTGVGAVVGGLAGLFSGGKKAEAKYQPLDIAKVISDARSAASDTLKNSINLESTYRPGTAALRTTADTALGNLISGATPGYSARDSLLTSLEVSGIDSNATSNPLLTESAGRILSNLRLGGTLGKDVQAQAMQAALEKAGTAGISGSGAARGLVARDLGLTSLALEKDRIAQAQAAGTDLAQLSLAQQQLKLNDLLGRVSAASGAANLDTQRTNILASLIDARALPDSGLNPGAIASLYVADNNAKNQIDTTNAAIGQQQRNANLNALLGLGSLAAGSGDALASLFKPKKAVPDLID